MWLCTYIRLYVCVHVSVCLSVCFACNKASLQLYDITEYYVSLAIRMKMRKNTYLN